MPPSAADLLQDLEVAEGVGGEHVAEPGVLAALIPG